MDVDVGGFTPESNVDKSLRLLPSAHCISMLFGEIM